MKYLIVFLLIILVNFCVPFQQIYLQLFQYQFLFDISLSMFNNERELICSYDLEVHNHVLILPVSLKGLSRVDRLSGIVIAS